MKTRYEEHPSRLPGAVLWSSTTDGAHKRVLPDGCMDLLWVHGRLLIAGPDTGARLVNDAPGTRYVGLRFAPGTGPSVFGVPAHELRDRQVPLDAVWPGAEVRRLAERTGEAADAGRALEAVAQGRLRTSAAYDALVFELRRGSSVTSAAGMLGLSERQLHRRCLAAFGYGPKTLARILRLERSLGLARGGLPLADVAAVAGFADQAHLSRDVRALAGVPVSELLAA
jgi:AraC-like DNA-binding protein